MRALLLLVLLSGCGPLFARPAAVAAYVDLATARVAIGEGVDEASGSARLAEAASQYLVAGEPGHLRVRNRAMHEVRLRVDRGVALLDLANAGGGAIHRTSDLQLAREYLEVTHIARRVLAPPDKPRKARGEPAKAEPKKSEDTVAEPEPPAEIGRLEVTSDKPGKVYVDGEPKGPAPVTVDRITPGVHKVRIVLDDGGELRRTAFVSEGMTARTRFEGGGILSGDTAFSYRKGIHFGAQAGVALPAFISPRGGAGAIAGGAASFIANYGATEWFDFRACFRASAAGGNGYVWSAFEIPLTARFDIGSVYTIAVGVAAGADVVAGTSRVTTFSGGTVSTEEVDFVTGFFAFGPELSLASVRLGPKRQFELEYLQSIHLLVGASDLSSHALLGYYRQTLTLSYLFL